MSRFPREILLPIMSLFALLCGCGGRTPLLEPSTGACETLAWAACSPTGPVAVVRTVADSPSLAFTGSVLLMGHQTDTGVGLTVLSPDGVPKRSVAIRGINEAKVAYHPELGTAVVLSEGGVTWLDSAGNVIGAPVEAPISNVPDLMLTPEGFLGLLSEHGGQSPALLYGRIGANPMQPDWRALTSAMSFSGATHSEDDLGYGKWIVFWESLVPSYQLFEVASPAPVAARTLESLLPEVRTGGAFEALFEDGGHLYGIFGGVLPGGDQRWAMWLVDLSAAEPLAWRLDRAPNGPDAAVLRIGSDLVFASSIIHPDDRMSLAQLRPGAAEPLGDLVVLGNEGNLSRSASFAHTPRGFAVAWWEGTHILEGIRLAMFDCCVRPGQ